MAAADEDQDTLGSTANELSNTGLRADEMEGMQAYTYAEKVLGMIEEMGLSRRERPRVTSYHEGLTGMKAGQYFDGRLPPVLVRLSLDKLSALYSLFTSWYGYVMAQMHSVMIERSEAKRQREFLLSMIRQQHKLDPDRVDPAGNPRKRPTQEMSDMAKLDIRFIKEDARYEQLNMLYQYLEAMAEVTDQDMKMISREITIQQIKVEAEYMRRGMASGSVRLPGADSGSFRNRMERNRDDTESESDEAEAPARQAVRRPVPRNPAAPTVPRKAQRIRVHGK